MDWELGGAISTTVGFRTGDASLYLSSGGGVIGSRKVEDVNAAAKKLVQSGELLISATKPARSTALPGKGMIVFYLLTNKGLYSAADSLSRFEDSTSALMPLFNAGNKVIASLRKADQGL